MGIGGSAGTLGVGVEVLDPHPYDVSHDICLRWSLRVPDVGRDHRPIRGARILEPPTDIE